MTEIRIALPHDPVHVYVRVSEYACVFMYTYFNRNLFQDVQF
jgi:hypothetical protein